MSEELNVLDYYIAPQGEGPYAGYRSLFIRMSGCTVGCNWCDEAQTWKKRTNGVTVEELRDALREFESHGPKLYSIITITGGEPLEDPEGLNQILEVIYSMDFRIHFTVTVETSGTRPPLSTSAFQYAGLADYTLSPKPFAMPTGELKRVWMTLLERSKARLKLVVSNSAEAAIFIDWMGEWPRVNPFHIQPKYNRKLPEFDQEGFKDAYSSFWAHGLPAIVTLQMHKHIDEK